MTRLGKLLKKVYESSSMTEKELKKLLNSVGIKVLNPIALRVLFEKTFDDLTKRKINSLFNVNKPEFTLSDNSKVKLDSDKFDNVFVSHTKKHLIFPNRWLRCRIFNEKLTVDKLILRFKEVVDYLTEEKNFEKYCSKPEISLKFHFPKSNLTVITNFTNKDNVKTLVISTITSYPKYMERNGFSSKELKFKSKREKEVIVLNTETHDRLLLISDNPNSINEFMGLYYDEEFDNLGYYFYEDDKYFLEESLSSDIETAEIIIDTE